MRQKLTSNFFGTFHRPASHNHSSAVLRHVLGRLFTDSAVCASDDDRFSAQVHLHKQWSSVIDKKFVKIYRTYVCSEANGGDFNPKPHEGGDDDCAACQAENNQHAVKK